MDRAKKLHRRAQKAEGALASALYQLDICEQFYLREGVPGSRYLLKQTINEVRKALNRHKK